MYNKFKFKNTKSQNRYEKSKNKKFIEFKNENKKKTIFDVKTL